MWCIITSLSTDSLIFACHYLLLCVCVSVCVSLSLRSSRENHLKKNHVVMTCDPRGRSAITFGRMYMQTLNLNQEVFCGCLISVLCCHCHCCCYVTVAVLELVVICILASKIYMSWNFCVVTLSNYVIIVAFFVSFGGKRRGEERRRAPRARGSAIRE